MTQHSLKSLLIFLLTSEVNTTNTMKGYKGRHYILWIYRKGDIIYCGFIGRETLYTVDL